MQNVAYIVDVVHRRRRQKLQRQSSAGPLSRSLGTGPSVSFSDSGKGVQWLLLLLRISRSPSGRHLSGSGSTFRRRALLDLPGQERKVVDVDAEVAAAAVVVGVRDADGGNAAG